ncbi:hypothetical protein CANCADRAFT_51470 [Tortispora caseinolytica NRRL Y-17796]|uniref:Enoyl-CoA hydratase n=1 Tax=Tortispora caseinolytica NRRL Y-17796 TaxID=767744 RepID=A0A1E4TGP5_9ASCO|nr:hypothetical protein CANCADRAFT_51470 [Tortispora caseinolytica NRRL Y-17796]
MTSYGTFDFFNVSIPVEFVAVVETNRPKKLNAFNEATHTEFYKIITKLDKDPNVRVIVLTGTGDKAFSAGLDISDAGLLVGMQNGDSSRLAYAKYKHIKEFQDHIGVLQDINKPVIAVFHGISYGLAVDIGAAADIRICSQDTRFAIREVMIGLAADIGSLQRVGRIVGNHSWLRDLAYTAREFSAEEAKANGFVSEVHTDKQAALAAGLKLASNIAANSPIAVQGTKRMMVHALDHTIKDGLEYIASWNAFALGEDPVVAIQAVKAKKKARFSNL